MGREGDVDGLLKDYLASSAGEVGSEVERDASPVASAALKKLLNRYLATNDDEEVMAFATRRSNRVDDLLRRYVEDREDVGRDLTEQLRAHLQEEQACLEADGGVSSSAAGTGSGEDWAHQAASSIHGIGSLDDRLAGYVESVVQEEEAAAAFQSDEESTIKGVAPGGIDPVPLGSEKAKRIKRESEPHAASERKADD